MAGQREHLAFSGHELYSSCPSRFSVNFSGLGYVASPPSRSLLHNAKSSAVCFEIGAGRILITAGESLLFGDS